MFNLDEQVSLFKRYWTLVWWFMDNWSKCWVKVDPRTWLERWQFCKYCIQKEGNMGNSGIIWGSQHELQWEVQRRWREGTGAPGFAEVRWCWTQFGLPKWFDNDHAIDDRRELAGRPKSSVYWVQNWWGSSWESLWRKVSVNSLSIGSIKYWNSCEQFILIFILVGLKYICKHFFIYLLDFIIMATVRVMFMQNLL